MFRTKTLRDYVGERQQVLIEGKFVDNRTGEVYFTEGVSNRQLAIRSKEDLDKIEWVPLDSHLDDLRYTIGKAAQNWAINLVERVFGYS